MEELIVEIVNQYGYFGIFALLAIECIFPPIPSELILTLSGFLTIYSTLTFLGVVIASILGSIVGALVLYLLGYMLDSKRLEKLFSGKIGRAFRLKRDDVRKAEFWFGKFGGKAVFLGRMIPIVRSLISIPAGMARMNIRRFLLLTISGTLIWNSVLVFLGIIAGSAWNKIMNLIGIFSNIVLIILILALMVAIMVFIKKRFVRN